MAQYTVTAEPRAASKSKEELDFSGDFVPENRGADDPDSVAVVTKDALKRARKKVKTFRGKSVG